MIEARGLTKKFGNIEAVSSVDFEIRPGECFGLLGPNGAGKSTIMSMIYGAVLRSGGDLRVFGKDPSTEGRAIKKRLGVVTQENALDESLTVYENMWLYSGFYGVAKKGRAELVNRLLEFMSLTEKKDAKIQFLSGGMKRRLVFVRALLGNPELLMLDEPTTGLDPAVRHVLWGRVRDLKAKGMTVLLTTHYMHEAEALSDRVAIMNHGKILTVESPQELIRTHGAKNLEEVFLKLTGEVLSKDD